MVIISIGWSSLVESLNRRLQPKPRAPFIAVHCEKFFRLRSSQREFAGSDINGACNVRGCIGSQCIEQLAMAGKAHSAQIE